MKRALWLLIAVLSVANSRFSDFAEGNNLQQNMQEYVQTEFIIALS